MASSGRRASKPRAIAIGAAITISSFVVQANSSSLRQQSKSIAAGPCNDTVMTLSSAACRTALQARYVASERGAAPHLSFVYTT